MAAVPFNTSRRLCNDVMASSSLGGYARAPIECQDVPASRAGAAHGVGRLRLRYAVANTTLSLATVIYRAWLPWMLTNTFAAWMGLSGAPHARPQSWRVASRAPSASAANFSQATLGWVSLNRMPEAAKPQSAPAMTLSRPTIRAKRTM